MFKVSLQGAVHVFSGTAPLNSEHISLAKEACEQCFGKGQPHLVLHLSGIPLIDSEGLELLLDLRDRCMKCGGAVHLSAPNVLCRDILQATGLAGEFAIFDDQAAAVGSFAQ